MEHQTTYPVVMANLHKENTVIEIYNFYAKRRRSLGYDW